VTNKPIAPPLLSQLFAPESPILLAIILLISGAVVMMYELVGTRVVAPYLGASTYVWTSIIGVVLASLSLGYWLGGNWADNRPAIYKLAPIFGLASILVACTGWLSMVVGVLVQMNELPLEVEASLAALILFAPTATLLGFISPYITRLQVRSLATMGKRLGAMAAFSTIGSIIGTFLAGFWLIPLFGTEQLLLIIACILMLLGMACAALGRQWRMMIGVLIVASLVVGIRQLDISRTTEIDVDTAYSRVKVEHFSEPSTGRPMVVLKTDAGEAQSAMYLDGDDYVFAYTKLMDVFAVVQPRPKQALILGGAGYTMPRHLVQWESEPTVTVVEIDPDMTELARQHFKLVDHPRLSIKHADARTFLSTSDTQFDVIMIDVFSHGYGIPFHILTKQSLHAFQQRLQPDGVIVANVIGAPQGKHDALVGSIYKTFLTQFPTVLLFSTHPDKPTTLQNVIILATATTITAEQLASSSYAASQLSQPPLGGKILTDDFSPMEAMVRAQSDLLQ
jgi:spermidine synthase